MSTDDADLLADAVAAARTQDPSIDPEVGLRLAGACLRLLRADPQLDSTELARRCVADQADADASWVNYIARALRA